MMITPVLLCGGSGTRLWPISRKSYPKQFVPLTGEKSLFTASAERLSGPDYAPPVVVTGSDFRFIVTEQLMQAGVDPGAILIEPEGRDTAPAILAGALQAAHEDPEALVLAAPSDHAIPDDAGFRATIQAGLDAAKAGRILPAIRAYREVVAGGDRRPLVLYDLGTALLAADSLDAAVDALERATFTGEPALRERALYNLGVAYLRRGLRADGESRALQLRNARK